MLLHAELRIDISSFAFQSKNNGYAQLMRNSYVLLFYFCVEGITIITDEFPIFRVCILTNTKINF